MKLQVIYKVAVIGLKSPLDRQYHDKKHHHSMINDLALIRYMYKGYKAWVLGHLAPSN